ncbi:hypothetical protein EBZ80_02235 [bacterium]|nr:hypothetical protein [bacterium]
MGNGSQIRNEAQLEKSWNSNDGIWEADDGISRERFFREGLTYDKLRDNLRYYLDKIRNRKRGISIIGYPL